MFRVLFVLIGGSISTIVVGLRGTFNCKYSRNFSLATTELFIESGNVHIETKRVLTNPDFPTIRPRRDASKSYIRIHISFRFNVHVA